MGRTAPSFSSGHFLEDVIPCEWAWQAGDQKPLNGTAAWHHKVVLLN